MSQKKYANINKSSAANFETKSLEVKTFHSVTHTLSRTYLDETFAMAETPETFKTVLYPHQATVVRAILDIENQRHITGKFDCFDEITTKPIYVESNYVVLSEQLGSGKTVMILAIIVISPIPKAFPLTIRVDNPDQCIVTRKFTGNKALMRQTLIVVGSSVLLQWEEAISAFTNLKCFTIGDVRALKKFITMFEDGSISQYDIILLKNGDVTSNINFPSWVTIDASKELYDMITVMNSLCVYVCWPRVVYDDFNTVHIPKTARIANALFTIFVSSTKKFISNKGHCVKPAQDSIMPLIKDVNPDDCPILFGLFNIANTPEFTERSTKITIIEGYKYVFHNPDDQFMRLLGVMNDRIADNVMEMLNGDAPLTAASSLGIVSPTAFDVFEKVLADKYDIWKESKEILAVIRRVKSLPLKLHIDFKQHSDEKLSKIKHAIIKKTVPEIKYASEKLSDMLEMLQADYSRKHEESGRAMARVQDNIKEDMCQVCTLPLEDSDAIIIKCCGVVLCDVCGIKCCDIKKRFNYKTKSESIIGNCANCKSQVNIMTDMIFINKDFNIKSLTDDLELEKEQDEIEENATDNESEEENCEDYDEHIPLDDRIQAVKNPKIRALLQIYYGIEPENKTPIVVDIPQLLKGSVNIPQKPDTPRKIIAFSNYNESISLIEKTLKQFKISYDKLMGTAAEKHRVAKKFEATGSVLLINSQQNCAGLNLQFATDIISFHEIIDDNIRGQIFARGQRLGRDKNLRIHYLMYQNEEKIQRRD